MDQFFRQEMMEGREMERDPIDALIRGAQRTKTIKETIQEVHIK